MTRKNLFALGLCAAASLCFVSASHAITAQWSSPDLDRWMYPFNATPGTRAIGSTFGAVGAAGFDERDAQVLAGFDTSAQIPTGLTTSDYNITKVTLTATVSGGTFAYDPTHDPLATYQAGGIDADAGRPVELFGVGFRGGYTELDFTSIDAANPPGFQEGEAFGSHNGNPGTFDRDRSAFALGENAGVLVDVSNNVADNFETKPWAIGTTNAVVPGSDVPAGTTLTFELDLSDPLILAYLQSGLSAGQLGLVLTSLNSAAFGGPATYPNFFLDTGTQMTLDIEYTIGQSTGGNGAIPEPTSLALLALSLACFTRPMRRRECL